MPHWKTFLNKEYLGEWDLMDDEKLTLTITKVEGVVIEDPITNEKDYRPLLFFKELKKGFIANIGSGDNISLVCGSKITEDWIGKRIILFKDLNAKLFGKKRGPALRVSKKTPPPLTKPNLTPEHKHWKSAIEAIKKDPTGAISKVKEHFVVSAEIEKQLLEQAK